MRLIQFPENNHRSMTLFSSLSRGQRSRCMGRLASRFGVALLLAVACLSVAPTFAATAEVKDVTVQGGIQEGKARLVIEAQLNGLSGTEAPLLFSTGLEQWIRITTVGVAQTLRASMEILQGDPRELMLTLAGEGEVTAVTGDAVQDWGVRVGTNGLRTLVVRTRKAAKPWTHVDLTIQTAQEWKSLPQRILPLTVTPPAASLLQGFARVDASGGLRADIAVEATGVIPMEPRFLPESLRREPASEDAPSLAFRFQGASYSLPLLLSVVDPESRSVVARDAELQGRVVGNRAEFVWKGIAHVTRPQGGTLALLSGAVALSTLEEHRDWKLKFENGQFLAEFSRAGDFPIQIRFNAQLGAKDGWSSVDFRVASSSLQRVKVQGLSADTQFQTVGMARPQRVSDEFVSYLPSDGAVRLSWKQTRPELEGKLFYSAEMLSQLVVSPGLLRETCWVQGKVMQGEMTECVLLLRGAGNVTRISGTDVLSWRVEAGAKADERRAIVRFNQPQRDAFTIQAQFQVELAAFPQSLEMVAVSPEGATRFAGYMRVVNDGAVRLEILPSRGISQISPEQFPETEATQTSLPAKATQRFAFRFAGADYSLRLQADNVLPEVTVSEILSFHLGETELSLEAELELDIREAPIRELMLRAPRGYVLAKIQAPGVADYFASDLPNETDTQLRLVYAQPVSGRQLLQLRWERNAALGETSWTLPRVEVTKAKSTRGHVGVSADAGFRLTPEKTQGLTDIATAFFPKKTAGIQAAFRLSDAAWQATLKVERLPQSIQADVFHLFSLGEGMAYGSSTMSYSIAGAPVSSFRVELASDYANVEFVGKDVRNWQKSTNGYLVQLHTAVSGSYALLATYERPFKAQGDTLSFSGARPLDVSSEQGDTLIISAYQFRVKPVAVSPGLLALETGEVPPEHRLFFDAPILAAYRYTARPFELQLSLSPLSQAETLSLVVDRASLTTRVSKDGEVVTDARYVVKNRGNTHLRLAVPEGATLWSVQVNGAAATPVRDGTAQLIPLGAKSDPNTPQIIEVKIATRAQNPSRLAVDAPVLDVPVLLADWRLEGDAGQSLRYRGGSLLPAAGVLDPTGFAMLLRWMRSSFGTGLLAQCLIAFGGLVVCIGACRWASGAAMRRSLRSVLGNLVSVGALALTVSVLASLAMRSDEPLPTPDAPLLFVAPIQEPGNALHLEVANVPMKMTVARGLAEAWPAFIALVLGLAALRSGPGFTRSFYNTLAWTCLAWAALLWPRGVTPFFALITLFVLLQLVPMLLRNWGRLPQRIPSAEPPSPASPMAMTLLVGCALLSGVHHADAAETNSAESVSQSVRVEGGQVFGSATLRWSALTHQLLPIVDEPAVLTRIQLPSHGLRMVQTESNGKRIHHLLAETNGTFEVTFDYQLPTARIENDNGFVIPVRPGLVNVGEFVLIGLDVDVECSAAASLDRKTVGTNTVVSWVLRPVGDAVMRWRPRSRDVRHEAAVFFVDATQLYAPVAGVIEGVHIVQIKPAQGEVSELVFDVPEGATITDVREPAAVAPATADKKILERRSIVSLWRFDPDRRQLRVKLSPAPARTFTLVVRSQVSAGPLPYTQKVGWLHVVGAAGQVGSVGFATGSEVQLDQAQGDGLSAINIEDFASSPVQVLAPQIPGLTVRRAYRYAESNAGAVLRASAVEADIRVETEETLSLGEDRTLLATQVKASVSRAGIFRLSFVLPAGFEMESVSGPMLSHWTELKVDTNRIVTLHLKGKTEGDAPFNITLIGPGSKAGLGWVVPKLLVREASKQRGQMWIVPEHGLRLQVARREGVTQLDPEKSGVRQRGVLGFRLLQSSWSLALDLEQVDAWVQVTGLQHATVGEAQLKVAANLQYQIENAGLKAFRLRLPTNAESLRIHGEQVADFLPTVGASQNGMQTWEVKLHRRVVGKYLLQISYQIPFTGAVSRTSVAGIQAMDVNLQRGFVTIESSGRLRVRVTNLPPAMQTADWQSIPRALLQDLGSASANYTFRLVDPVFDLPLELERHEPTRLQAAQVKGMSLTSVISDTAVMLTEVKLELLPGDKRLLRLTLPRDARFWFAFVNQQGAWPWKEGDDVLIPLEPSTEKGKASVVDFFYSSRVGENSSRALDLRLLGPKLDLPLENIVWRVFLNEKWQMANWGGSLQLEEARVVRRVDGLDLQSYLSNEVSLKQEQTKQAEQMLNFGNSLLNQGDPRQARRAFQSAYSLSTHDDAFNEDARVQLHNLKVQQALLGLNVRQNALNNDSPTKPADELHLGKNSEYTQKQAKQILAAKGAEENAALTRLAERLIQQQDAVLPSPTAIRATLPEQGRVLTFRRTVQVDPSADLQIELRAVPVHAASWVSRFGVLVAITMAFAALLFWVQKVSRPATSHLHQ